MACSASVGSRRVNRSSHASRVGVKAGLWVSVLSLAAMLTPGILGTATVNAAIPPPHSANPASSNSLIEDCFRQARDAEQSTLDWQHRVSSLLAIGRAQLVAGDAAGARATALDALRQIPADAGNPEDVGSNIGFTDGLPLKGVVAEAIELLAQSGDPAGALRASDRLRDGEDRAETLLTVADVYAAFHDLTAAKIALNESWKSGFALHDDSDRGETLSRLAAAWQRIDPQEIPASLIPVATAALRDATNAWGWGRSPVKLVNCRWGTSGSTSLPARVVKSYVRMGMAGEAKRMVHEFEAHGYKPMPTLAQEFRATQSGIENNNSVLQYTDLVPISTLDWVEKHPSASDGVTWEAEYLRSNYANLLLTSKESDDWTIADKVTQVADRPWSSLSDLERKLIQQVRSDLVGRAGRSADGSDRAYLLCAAARLDMLIGDREDARGLIGQATALCDAPVTDASSAARTFGHLGKYRDMEAHGWLFMRLTEALCTFGDFSGAARLAEEKGGPDRITTLQKIALYAAKARAVRRALLVSAEIEKAEGAANRTFSDVTNILVHQHDWDDAHQAAMSIKDPSARVHALVNLIDGYYGRESAY